MIMNILSLKGQMDFAIHRIVTRICSTSDPNQIEYVIIRIYVTVVFWTGILIGSLKLLKLWFGPKREEWDQDHTPRIYRWVEESSEWDQEFSHQSIVDVYLDLNCFKLVDISIQSIFNEFRKSIEICRTQSGSELDQILRLKFWCYINFEDNDCLWLKDQLDQVSRNLLTDQYVEVIDTSSNPNCLLPSSPHKQLLTDLLTVSNVTAGKRLYVISTNDPDISQYGLQLLKSYPGSPLICFVNLISGLEQSFKSESADFLFQWNEGALVPEEKRQTLQKNVVSPLNLLDSNQFRPLVLILRAYGPIGIASLRLGTLISILKAMQFHFDARPQEEQDEEVLNYIDLALAKGVVSLSHEFNSDKLSREESTIVKLDQRLAKMDPLCQSNDLLNRAATESKSDPKNKFPIEDDGLTTTGSDSEVESTSQLSSPTNLRGEMETASSPPSRFQDSPKTHHPVSKALKHGHGSLDMVLTPEGPVKKKKKQGIVVETDRPPKKAFGLAGSRTNTKRRVVGANSSNLSEPQAIKKANNDEQPILTSGSALVHDPDELPHAEFSVNGKSQNTNVRPHPANIHLPSSRTSNFKLGTNGETVNGYETLPLSPRLWMHSCSGMIEGAPLSLSLNHFHRHHLKRKTSDPTIFAHQRFASLFSPALVDRKFQAYPFPQARVEEERDVD